MYIPFEKKDNLTVFEISEDSQFVPLLSNDSRVIDLLTPGVVRLYF